MHFITTLLLAALPSALATPTPIAGPNSPSIPLSHGGVGGDAGSSHGDASLYLCNDTATAGPYTDPNANISAADCQTLILAIRDLPGYWVVPFSYTHQPYKAWQNGTCALMLSDMMYQDDSYAVYVVFSCCCLPRTP
jgi:hypothetical protein